MEGLEHCKGAIYKSPVLKSIIRVICTLCILCGEKSLACSSEQDRGVLKTITGVESKRERMKKLNCLSIQEKENTRLIYREKTILGEAEYHIRVRSRLPVPELGLLLCMGAGEAHGGRRGWWG